MRNYGIRHQFTEYRGWPDLPEFTDVDPPYEQPWTFGEVAALLAVGLAGWACIAGAVAVVAKYQGWW